MRCSRKQHLLLCVVVLEHDEPQQSTKTMPSIAAFIQGLLSEDMYATGMIENMDQRCVKSKKSNNTYQVLYCFYIAMYEAVYGLQSRSTIRIQHVE